MRRSKLSGILALGVLVWAAVGAVGCAQAQGTKDPSGLGPTMNFPIRPRNEPGGTTATPNTSHTVPQRTIRLHRTYRYGISGAYHPRR
jgi:hypothetical protein